MQKLRRKFVKPARRARAVIQPPVIDRIFMSAGGSGSSFVNRALRSFGVKIAERPDVELRAADLPDLHRPASIVVRTMFNRRVDGFEMDGERTIEANLLDYVRFLERQPHHTALFSNVPSFGFFRRNRIRNVVLLVRNPVQAYISFAKPERHLDLCEEWGGAFTEPSMRRYVVYWVTFVREYLALKADGLEPGLLRYESLLDDARAIGIERFFLDWKRSRNQVDKPEAAAFIRSLVDAEYRQIYPSWDL